MGENNEKLALLGNSLVRFLVSLQLYLLMPDVTDGELSVYRSALVRNTSLARAAKVCT